MEKIINLEHVGYWYNENEENKVLSDITVGFERGRFYAITGPSGAGKTTLLSILSGLDVPKQGEVQWEEINIQQIGLQKFRSQYVSMVFQGYNLLPYMTALQNVRTAMDITGNRPRKERRALALEQLERVGLSRDQALQKVLTLSGGQQQRTAIARALSCETEVIIADEPTGNLDEKTAEEIINIFKYLAFKERKCVILVTHDPSVAEKADVRVQLAKGHLQVNEKNSLSI
ncbi:ABC transporter ATP-binding protein [uncultured Marinococcus sp.]|uniref:ABC transporter ATP-binding protein n=1 Tax=uncultured Marinococcus sp. TaxID=487012 RepID=UPI002616EC49|nr:ABC transporter ATP-binding protein [uncultured Marinococcus sp.]